MNTNNNNIIEQLESESCPFAVDVKARVMSAICNRPSLKVVRRRKTAIRWSAAAVVAFMIAASVNLTILFTKDYNEDQIGNMMATVYSYEMPDSDSQPFMLIESFYDE